jgi:predicted ATPase
MISSISVSGFKCFSALERLALKPLSVFVGSNAAGKSTLIQVLLLLRQSIDIDGRIREVRLSGELYSGGTAKDVVRLDADRRMSFAIEEDSGLEVRVETTYESGTNPRALRALQESPAGSKLAYQPGASQFAYLAAERIGPKVAYPITTENLLAGPIGKHGERAAFFMARAKYEDMRLHDGWQQARTTIEGAIASASFGSPPEVTAYPLAAGILDWIMPGVSFDAIEDADADQSRLTFNNYSRDPLATVRPTNIGFGLTQILPVIGGLIALEKGGLFILENPEAHLHPLGQSRVGRTLALAAGTGLQVILETHSDHVVNGIRLAVKHKWIEADQVAFYYFTKAADENVAKITVIGVDERGRLNAWPAGFFDQIEKDLSGL